MFEWLVKVCQGEDQKVPDALEVELEPAVSHLLLVLQPESESFPFWTWMFHWKPR